MAGQGKVGSSALASETLARRYFEHARSGNAAALVELLHPEVEVILKTRASETLTGPDEVARFLAEVAESRQMMESTAERFRALDENRVVVEGRMRWMDEQHVLRDDPVVWALEFSDGLLRRSTPVSSVGEAVAVLAVPASSESAAAR